MKLMKKGWLVAALLTVGVLAGVQPAGATRDRPPDGSNIGWEWYGGTPTDAGDSVDGPKKSNAYKLDEGAVVYRRGYWDVPLGQYQAGFSYKGQEEINDGDGSPRISVILARADGSITGSVIYLDPYHCPSPYNSAGWATSNFFRTGSGCTIYTSWNQSYTGKDATYGPDNLPGGGDDTLATSAWAEVIADVPDQETLASYGFLIADWEGSTEVDRVRFGGDVLSAFPTNASPDKDNDGVVDRSDNCPAIDNADQADVDGDSVGDACDAVFELDATYSGTSGIDGSFAGNFDQAPEGAIDGAYVGAITAGDLTEGCYPLSGQVVLNSGSNSLTADITSGSRVCPSAGGGDVWDLTLQLSVVSGTGLWDGASGTLAFTGTQGPLDAGVRASTGQLTGTINLA